MIFSSFLIMASSIKTNKKLINIYVACIILLNIIYYLIVFNGHNYKYASFFSFIIIPVIIQIIIIVIMMHVKWKLNYYAYASILLLYTCAFLGYELSFWNKLLVNSLIFLGTSIYLIDLDTKKIRGIDILYLILPFTIIYTLPLLVPEISAISFPLVVLPVFITLFVFITNKAYGRAIYIKYVLYIVVLMFSIFSSYYLYPKYWDWVIEVKNINNKKIDIALLDVNNNQVLLSTHKSKVKYLYFWNYHCGPCVRNIGKVYGKYNNKGMLYLIHVNHAKTESAEVNIYYKEKPYYNNIYYVNDKELYKTIRINSFPTFITLNNNIVIGQGY